MTKRRWVAAGLATMMSLPATAMLAAPASAAPGDSDYSILVFSKTAGFRHSSIPTGIAAIEQLGAENNFAVDATEDATQFTDENLAGYDAVVWLSTTGDVLNEAQEAAFERYIQSGGGYAGIHAASDTEYDWAWYGDLVGAYFAGHPAQQDATVVVEDPAHPSTEELPVIWDRFDEWYNFRSNPRADVHVLASLDESTYDAGGSAMGADHPIAWCQDYDGGRAWYTGGGHTEASFSEPLFLDHLLGGIQTAAGAVDADCTASLTGSFEKVTLDDTTSNPMELDVADDGRVFYIDRNGEVKVIKPDGSIVTAGDLDVYTGQEYGLLGIALDPNFAENGWLYLYYSPQGSEPIDRVSRFTVTGDMIDMASEEVVLELDVQRDQCCHAGGALEFDGNGDLYIATGDNTNPFASDGYAPIDERDGRHYWDAQRTSANSNNLSGKVLRIHPEADGSYSIPEGNLFDEAADTGDQTRPEIFAMGFRNPFRIGLDPQTGNLLVADYGPDAGGANPDRGPDGRVEWNIVDEPGFYGWPYCVGENTPYHDYDFATGQSGELFNCDAPINDSPNNTGLTELPPAIPAEVWFGKSSTGAPEIGTGGAPMAGGVYRYDPALESERKWPAYWDGKAIFGEWNQSNLYSFQLNAEGTDVVEINEIFTEWDFARPHAFEWGPDGALYMIEWGGGFGGNNADSGIYRIDYVQGNRAPIVRASADVTSGPLPLVVQFSGEGSRDLDGTAITYAWDFDGDGTTDSTEVSPSFTYTEAGNYTARLTVTDEDGRTAVGNIEITAGNSAPVITVEAPVNGGFFEFGDQIRYQVSVTDAEDGTVDCENVVVQPGLGHDEHAHGYEQYSGCEGIFPLPGDQGHIGANIFGVVTVTYTDQGAPGVGPITSQEVIVLNTKHLEAEYFDATGRLEGSTSGGGAGVQTEGTADVGGGENIGSIEPGDWFAFDPVNLTNIDTLLVRGASSPGGTMDIRTGSPDGPSLGTITIPSGGWQDWSTYTLELPDDVTTESGPLYFVATSGQYNVNWVEFVGRGVTDNQSPEVTASATPVSGTVPLSVDFTAGATDPDGDDPLTYAWNFGDGGTADTADATHVYTEAGTFTATVTVTDARGATSSESVEVTVGAQNTTCFTGRSDDFTGDSLDTDRWTTVVRANQDLRVEDGSLVIPTSSTDIYGAGEGNTPNIVLQDLPEGAFTATAKVTMPGAEAYQQAGLVIYGDDQNYAKMVFEARNTTEADPNSRIFQFIREENGTPNEVADSNTANLGADYPSTVWVRFTSDGSNLTASYSADGVTFTQMPETKSLAGIEDPKIGLISLQGNDRPQAPVDAEFDYFSITPDDTATAAGPDDEFDGIALDGCRWNVVRPDPAHLRVVDGHLELDTTTGDIYGASDSEPNNFVLQPQPEGDWTIETKVDAGALNQRYQQAGLIAYVDDDNYVKLDVLAVNQAGNPVDLGLELRSEIDDVVQQPQPSFADVPPGVWYLRLEKEGDTFTGSYSADGTNWTAFASVTNAPVAASGQVGLYTLGAASTDNATARFDYFRVLGDEPVDTTPPTVTISGVEDGVSYDSAEELTVSWEVSEEADVTATLDGEALENGATLSGLAAGEHTIEVTATDAAGNEGTASVTFTVTEESEEPGNIEEQVGAYLDQLEAYVAEGRLDRRVLWQMQAGVERVMGYYEAGNYAKVEYELRKQMRTLEQNRRLVPDDEVWDYIVAEGTAILEAMIEEGEGR